MNIIKMVIPTIAKAIYGLKMQRTTKHTRQTHALTLIGHLRLFDPTLLEGLQYDQPPLLEGRIYGRVGLLALTFGGV